MKKCIKVLCTNQIQNNWQIFFVISLTFAFDLEDCYRYSLKYRRIQPERELIHSQPVCHQERFADPKNQIQIFIVLSLLRRSV